MRNHLVSLVQHCCKQPLWSVQSRHLVSTTHPYVWPSTSRNVKRSSGSCYKPLLRITVSGLPEKQSNAVGVCCPALFRAGVIGLLRKEIDLRRVVRMSTDVSTPTVESVPEPEKYMFGPWKIDAREVFLVSEHCYCFVNLRPVVPGHILTWSLSIRYFLEFEEVTDLWLTAQRVGQKLEPFFSGSSLTLAIQDGPEAGQTVPHVHIHILPRRRKDFENNDEIYDELDKKEKELNEAKKEEEKHLNLDEERKDRSREEMFEEASKLRALFQ